MKYSRFEELPVWRDAIELGVAIFIFTAKPAFKGDTSSEGSDGACCNFDFQQYGGRLRAGHDTRDS